jgi:hypothetical protein
MAALSQMLQDINARELDANEAALSQCFPPPPELTPEARQHLTPFLSWCEQQRVRPLPAKPTSVAAFAQAQSDRGVPKDKIGQTLSAIEALHNAASVGNLCATPVVQIVTASWPKEWKEEFKTYPREAQAKIAAREHGRETALRQAQNRLAEERKRLKADAATSAADTIKENSNGEERRT